LTPCPKGYEGFDFVAKAKNWPPPIPHYLLVRQSTIPQSWIHEKTGAGNLEANRRQDRRVRAAVGTGGTLTVVSRYIQGTRGNKILTWP